MYFYHRHRQGGYGIAQSDGGMGIGTRIEYNASRCWVKTYLVQTIYQCTLVVALEIRQVYMREYLPQFGQIILE